jgi:hypothetical protein
MPAAFEGRNSMMITVIFFIDPNERPDFDRLYKRAGNAMAIQRAGICYIHACMNLLLNTTIGELYGLESYRRISDADNFGDIDHVISAQDELMNVCGQDLTYTLTESIAPFNTDLDHEVIFNNLIFLELKASHLDTTRRCLYLMILKKAFRHRKIIQ